MRILTSSHFNLALRLCFLHPLPHLLIPRTSFLFSPKLYIVILNSEEKITPAEPSPSANGRHVPAQCPPLCAGSACSECNLCVKQILLLINCLMECHARSISPFVNCLAPRTRNICRWRCTPRQRRLIGNNFTQTPLNGTLICPSLVTYSSILTNILFWLCPLSFLRL